LIAEHFLRRYSRVFGKAMDSIEPKAMGILMDHSWPGNVRELENAIQRAIIDAPGRSVRIEDLNLTCEEECRSEFTKVLDIGDYLPTGNFEKQLREYEATASRPQFVYSDRSESLSSWRMLSGLHVVGGHSYGHQSAPLLPGYVPATPGSFMSLPSSRRD
jgi:DNA-binding NtrC family response regulator